MNHEPDDFSGDGRQHYNHCPAPGCSSEAARSAVKDVFAILGVNVDVPAEVEEFRKSLRFGDSMRRAADKSVLAFWMAAIGIIAVAMLAKLGVR